MSPRVSDRDISRLLALLKGELSPGARLRLERRLERHGELRKTLERLRAARVAVQEVAHEETPELPFSRIEARIHWRANEHEQTRSARAFYGMGSWVKLTGASLALGAMVLLALWVTRAPEAPSPTTSVTARTHQPKADRSKGKVPTAPQELSALPLLMEGHVRVAPARGPIVPLEINRPVLVEERLLTGPRSRVALQWAEGTGLELNANAELQLTELTSQRQRLALHAGRVLVDVGRSTERRLFEVEAGPLRVKVLGTRFSVWLDKRSAGVEVYEGIVLASDAKLPKNVAVLLPGQKLHFSRPAGQMRMTLIRRRVAGPYVLSEWKGLSRVLARSGTLAVQSKPAGSQVMLDDRSAGRTNVRLRALEGRHLVALGRAGKTVAKQWVEVKAAKLQSVTLRMPRKAGAAVPPKPPASRSSKSIYDVFRRQTALIRACFRRAQRRKPNLAGKIVLQVKIGADGVVQRATVSENLRDAPEVGQCARSMVRGWRFPRGKQAAVVTYPFLFRRR